MIWHFLRAFYHYARFSFLHGNGQPAVSPSLSQNGIVLSTCIKYAHYGEFYLPLLLPTQQYELLLHLFADCACLHSSELLAVIHNCCHPFIYPWQTCWRAQAWTQFYRAPIRDIPAFVFSPVIPGWSFPLSQHTLVFVFLRDLTEWLRRTCSVTELWLLFTNIWLHPVHHGYLCDHYFCPSELQMCPAQILGQHYH